MSSRLEVLGLRASHEGIQSVKDNHLNDQQHKSPPKEMLQNIESTNDLQYKSPKKK